MQSVVKFNTEIVKPFLRDYSDAYILVTGNFKVTAADNDTRVAIKNYHPFTRASFKLNDEQVDTADHLDLTMNLYNMLEYSDNFADTTGSLYQYQRPEQNKGNNNALPDLTVNDSSSFNPILNGGVKVSPPQFFFQIEKNLGRPNACPVFLRNRI